MSKLEAILSKSSSPAKDSSLYRDDNQHNEVCPAKDRVSHSTCIANHAVLRRLFSTVVFNLGVVCHFSGVARASDKKIHNYF